MRQRRRRVPIDNVLRAWRFSRIWRCVFSGGGDDFTRACHGQSCSTLLCRWHLVSPSSGTLRWHSGPRGAPEPTSQAISVASAAAPDLMPACAGLRAEARAPRTMYGATPRRLVARVSRFRRRARARLPRCRTGPEGRADLRPVARNSGSSRTAVSADDCTAPVAAMSVMRAGRHPELARQPRSHSACAPQARDVQQPAAMRNGMAWCCPL